MTSKLYNLRRLAVGEAKFADKSPCRLHRKSLPAALGQSMEDLTNALRNIHRALLTNNAVSRKNEFTSAAERIESACINLLSLVESALPDTFSPLSNTIEFAFEDSAKYVEEYASGDKNLSAVEDQLHYSLTDFFADVYFSGFISELIEVNEASVELDLNPDNDPDADYLHACEALRGTRLKLVGLFKDSVEYLLVTA